MGGGPVACRGGGPVAWRGGVPGRWTGGVAWRGGGGPVACRGGGPVAWRGAVAVARYPVPVDRWAEGGPAHALARPQAPHYFFSVAEMFAVVVPAVTVTRFLLCHHWVWYPLAPQPELNSTRYEAGASPMME